MALLDLLEIPGSSSFWRSNSLFLKSIVIHPLRIFYSWSYLPPFLNSSQIYPLHFNFPSALPQIFFFQISFYTYGVQFVLSAALGSGACPGAWLTYRVHTIRENWFLSQKLSTTTNCSASGKIPCPCPCLYARTLGLSFQRSCVCCHNHQDFNVYLPSCVQKTVSLKSSKAFLCHLEVS